MALSCTGLSGELLTACEVMAAQLNPVECTGLQYNLLGTCQDYSSEFEKLVAAKGTDANINTGNTAWMLVSAALVMIMTPGVALFYGGLSGEKAVSNTIMMCLGSMCVISIQWFLFGYSFAFGPGNDAFGSFAWGALVDVTGLPSGAYGGGIPHYLWVAFQNMFAQITPAIIAGAVVGRMKFSAYIIFILIWTTVVYDPLAHWVWSLTIDSDGGIASLGWLGALGAADFAGGAVIHISSGFAALAAALVLGKRKEYEKGIKPHNIPMVLIGATLLWFGWFGFNAGSAGGSAGATDFGEDEFNGLASTAFINTHLAACMAAFTWAILEKIFDHAPTAAGAASGVVAGLVAITPACGFVLPWHSVIIGAIVSPFCYGAIKLKNFLGVDDTLDAWGIHGVGGIVGAFCTGLFATPQVNSLYAGAFYGFDLLLGYEVAACVVSASFSFVLSLVILLALDSTIGLRIPETAEVEGIDMSEHGGKAYDGGATTEIGFSVTPAAAEKESAAVADASDKQDV